MADFLAGIDYGTGGAKAFEFKPVADDGKHRGAVEFIFELL